MCWGIEQVCKNKYRPSIKSLSQHFEKEIYRRINITRLLLTGKQLFWSPFLILSIAKFLRAPIEEHLWTAASENVFMKLRKIKIYS